MERIQEKARSDSVEEINAKLEAAVRGLPKGSPERKVAIERVVEEITGSVPREVHLQPPWDFTAEKEQPVFTGNQRITIRPVQIADADFYVSVRAQYSMMYRNLVRMGKVDNESILKDDTFKPEVFYCIIEDATENTPAGYIAIKDTRDDIWEIAIELDDQFTHKGFGSESIRLFLNELCRITHKAEYQALVEVDNLPSQRCFEKIGAKLIGLHDGVFLKTEEEKARFEENNLNLINDEMKTLAIRMGVEPRKLLSHVLEYRMSCPL